MKKLSIVFVVLISMAFTTEKFEKNDLKNSEVILRIQEDISSFQNIITNMQLEAESLEVKAKELFKNNSDEAITLIEQANLLKMNCLKYEAAIACLERHLE